MPSPNHPASGAILKRADVDLRILPLVLWLSEPRNVYTLFSCEGDPPDADRRRKVRNLPYVLFHCWSPRALELIRDAVSPYGFELKEKRRLIPDGTRRRVRSHSITGRFEGSDLDGLCENLPTWPDDLKE